MPTSGGSTSRGIRQGWRHATITIDIRMTCRSRMMTSGPKAVSPEKPAMHRLNPPIARPAAERPLDARRVIRDAGRAPA